MPFKKKKIVIIFVIHLIALFVIMLIGVSQQDDEKKITQTEDQKEKKSSLTSQEPVSTAKSQVYIPPVEKDVLPQDQKFHPKTLKYYKFLKNSKIISQKKKIYEQHQIENVISYLKTNKKLYPYARLVESFDLKKDRKLINFTAMATDHFLVKLSGDSRYEARALEDFYKQDGITKVKSIDSKGHNFIFYTDPESGRDIDEIAHEIRKDTSIENVSFDYIVHAI